MSINVGAVLFWGGIFALTYHYGGMMWLGVALVVCGVIQWYLEGDI